MYPKIKIELNNDRLNALNIVWEIIDPSKPKLLVKQQEKAINQIVFEIKEKLQKLAVTREFKDGDFHIKLKYYEAVYFQSYLDVWLSEYNYSQFPYEWNVVHDICNRIKQNVA